MILTIKQNESLSSGLDRIGLGMAVRKGGSVLIKVNLANPPEPGRPRTDPSLLKEVLEYAVQHNARCAVAEGANGFLERNLESIGLGEFIRLRGIKIFDLDNVPFDEVKVEDETHYLPKCFRDYAVRLAIPLTSRRPGMIFSNNIKLFVGAVPRQMYQLGENSLSRPRIHIRLHKSVANIYRAVMKYAPFGFYVNGGKAMFDTPGEIVMENTFLGNDALELDSHILKLYGISPPEYIRDLAAENRG
jgi:uncharacterized protein (DUF362 family)